MNDSSAAKKAPTTAPPAFWSVDNTETGAMRLTFAIRGGPKQYSLVALGGTLLLAGCYGVYWLLDAGELTLAGIIFLLIPVSIALFGVYVLDIALVARTTYMLDSGALVWRRHSIFGDKSLEIPRDQIKGISQHYSPPGRFQARSDPGSWTTRVSYESAAGKKRQDFAIDGLSTPEEARWLGPLLARWAGMWLERGFAASHGEARPGELPILQDTQDGS